MLRTTLAAAAALAIPAAAPAAEFTIFLFEPASELALRPDPAEASPEGYWGAYGDFAQALIERGALKGGTALHTDAPTHLLAGEAAEGSLVPGALRLSGYFVVEAPDRAAAEALAALAPTTTRGGAAEVRESYVNPLAAMGSM